MVRIAFNGTRADVRQQARRLAAILAGAEPDTQGVARGFLLALGFGALSDIKDAFITKARGGSDEMGIQWPPLSKEYLAYGRRFGSGEQAALKKAAGLGKGHRYAPGDKKGLLSAGQLKRWRQIYASRLARFLLSMDEGAAKGRAAQIAWATLKREGAQTKLEVYGNRTVDILRDTGILFNSLSPGMLGGIGPDATYTKPTGNGGDEQVFDLGAGSVAVGTTVEYAAAHNFGGPKMPRRQFLPDSGDQVPDVWWERWFGIAIKALEAGAAMIYRGAA